MKPRNAAALSAALAALLALRCGAAAASPAGLPGAAWGDLTRGPASTEGTGTQGWLRQGVRWARLGAVDLETYAAWNWRLRSENTKYYNSYGPSLIAELSAGPLNAGAEMGWLKYPGLPEGVQSSSLYAGWYAVRDVFLWTGRLTPDGVPPLAMPLSAWGKVSYDMHGQEGSGSQGWVKQGVDWYMPRRGMVLDTYAAYHWRLRTKNKQYYNVYGPSLGVVLDCGSFSVGAEHSWQKFPQLGRSTRTFNLYVGWYYGWDLKKKQ